HGAGLWNGVVVPVLSRMPDESEVVQVIDVRVRLVLAGFDEADLFPASSRRRVSTHPAEPAPMTMWSNRSSGSSVGKFSGWALMLAATMPASLVVITSG